MQVNHRYSKTSRRLGFLLCVLKCFEGLHTENMLIFGKLEQGRVFLTILKNTVFWNVKFEVSYSKILVCETVSAKHRATLSPCSFFNAWPLWLSKNFLEFSYLCQHRIQCMTSLILRFCEGKFFGKNSLACCQQASILPVCNPPHRLKLSHAT